jgi:hypothetical protein
MKTAVVLLLLAATPALADLAAGSGGDSAATGAISRLAAARQGSAAALADKDVAGDVQRGSNLVYYSSLNGTPTPGGSDLSSTTGWTKPANCPPGSGPKPSPVPAPGAALLALIGFAGVNWLKRRA